MYNSKSVKNLESADFDGREITIRGLLLARGNVDGGEAWIAPDWERREDASSSVTIKADNCFEKLFEHLPALGGGPYSFCNEVTATGMFQQDGAFCPSEIIAEVDGKATPIRMVRD